MPRTAGAVKLLLPPRQSRGVSQRTRAGSPSVKLLPFQPRRVRFPSAIPCGSAAPCCPLSAPACAVGYARRRTTTVFSFSEGRRWTATGVLTRRRGPDEGSLSDSWAGKHAPSKAGADNRASSAMGPAGLGAAGRDKPQRGLSYRVVSDPSPRSTGHHRAPTPAGRETQSRRCC